MGSDGSPGSHAASEAFVESVGSPGVPGPAPDPASAASAADQSQDDFVDALRIHSEVPEGAEKEAAFVAEAQRILLNGPGAASGSASPIGEAADPDPDRADPLSDNFATISRFRDRRRSRGLRAGPPWSRCAARTWICRRR